MKSKFVIATAALLLLSGIAETAHAGEKSKLQWFSFEKGMAEAKKTNKKLLVDVYTDWCGWCKRMDAETYANSVVSGYLGEKYVVVKLNAESSDKQSYKGRQYTEQQLAGEFGVTGYPTTLFFTADGKPITGLPGYADADNFKTILSYIAEDHYTKTKFEDYAKGSK